MNEVEARRIILRNLVFDIEHRRVKGSVIRQFFRFVEESWPTSPPRPEPQRLVSRFIARDEDALPLLANRPRAAHAQCSRIMEALTFRDRHLRCDTAGSTTEDDFPDDEIERIAVHGVGPAAQGTLRSARPFAWVTKTDSVDALRKAVAVDDLRPNGKLATSVRDALGLFQYVRQEKLLEIIYPLEATKDATIVPPTFLEGSDIVFRSADGGDNWGCTLPLSGEGGLPEAVHTPIPFSDHFRIRPLGRPSATNVSLEWGKLAGDPTVVDVLAELLESLPDEFDDTES